MQLDLPFLRAPLEPASPATPRTDLPPNTPSVVYVRVRRARRYILRVRPDGTLRVTIPRGGSRAEAARFVTDQRRWIERQRIRLCGAHGPQVWGDGTAILLHGQPVTIRVAGAGHERVASYGGRVLRLPFRAEPDADLRSLIERDLRLLAREELPARLRTLATTLGFSVCGITIRNQRSRWGSCSRRGGIALNYRLVQMPSSVCDYVMIHELMHLEQQNHSVRFWRLVEKACPAFRDAERWLKREGPALF